ncbi:MAG: hypothetical protein AB7K24_32620 [Gemmataceae bacterium]
MAPVEFCDESGKVLGKFSPIIDPAELEFVLPELTEEELDERERHSTKRYTTAEVIAHLEKL